ncbi:nucleotidyltransferase domain-containing protein [Candidatus Roizmanbacteria bacterium]|nr:nucleotidyltransferase domain-containing protein [Candidatus Roizmanbacteria bacterium]
MKISFDQNQIENICSEQNIVYLGLFGSQARGEAGINSDVDVLIDFSETKSYFQLAKVQEELENIFQKKIDLVLKPNVKDVLRQNIFKDLKTLYEKK